MAYSAWVVHPGIEVAAVSLWSATIMSSIVGFGVRGTPFFTQYFLLGTIRLKERESSSRASSLLGVYAEQFQL